MDKLYAPWRAHYSRDKQDSSCVFCELFAQTNDAENFILGRGKNVIAILNTYPYNAGHIMLLPKTHVADIASCSQETRLELMNLANESIEVLTRILKSQGVNAGFNLGSAAGGSIPGHLHMHIVPRWAGDTNFLVTLADTKTITFDLREIYHRLRPEFEKLSL